MDSNTVTRHDRKTLGLVSAKQSQLDIFPDCPSIVRLVGGLS